MSVRKYYKIAKKILFPLNRSLTGEGTFKTLKIIKKQFPELKIKKIKSRTKVFDWKIPDEWNVKEAYIEDKFGKKIVDFKNNNLHLLGYSKKIKKVISKNELYKNIFYLKKQSDAIPYVTSYYRRNWGFSISYNQKKKIDLKYKYNDKFKVVINSKFNKEGFLRYGELLIKGSDPREILISTYVCHPSMANNELSGPIVSMSLIEFFKKKKNLKKSIRFLFIPETIGSIAYLKLNLKKMKSRVLGGYNLTCIGDERQHSCMFSKYENSPSDYSLKEAYKKLKLKYKVYNFLKRGSDERQYNSPNVDLKITSIFRTKYGEYPEYHTSKDNFNLVTIKGLEGGFRVAKKAIDILNSKIIPRSNILCEPQMGKRGLYETVSIKRKKVKSRDFMNFLQYADGNNSLTEISKFLMISINKTKKIFKILKKHKIIY